MGKAGSWELLLINESAQNFRVPRKFLSALSKDLQKYLKQQSKKDPELHNRLSQFEPAAGLTCVFVSDKKMQQINSQYRGKNKVTDVLSFEGEAGDLGELLLAPSQIERQAGEHGFSFQQELAYMFIHGVLHLLGYDHESSKADELKMFTLQDYIFSRIAQ